MATGNELRHRLWSDIIWEERRTALSLLVFKSGSLALPIEQPTVAQAGVLVLLSGVFISFVLSVKGLKHRKDLEHIDNGWRNCKGQTGVDRVSS